MLKYLLHFALVILISQSLAFAEGHDWIEGTHTSYDTNPHCLYWTYNFRLGEPQGFAIGVNLGAIPFEKVPLIAQFSPGLYGGKIGIGLGFGAKPEGPINGGIAPIGLGVKAAAFKKWGNVSSEKVRSHSTYHGIELSAAFLIGLDVGFFKESGGPDRFTSVSVGWGF